MTTATKKTQTLRVSRVIKAPKERCYRAFLDPAAMVKWSPPHGFTGTMHSMDARVGGTYRMSFTNFTTGEVHSFGGKYVELTPHDRIRYTDAFEDPNLPGTMQVTVEFKEVPGGTEVVVTQEGLPMEIPIEMAQAGWKQSFDLFAQLVEPEIRMG